MQPDFVNVLVRGMILVLILRVNTWSPHRTYLYTHKADMFMAPIKQKGQGQ